MSVIIQLSDIHLGDHFDANNSLFTGLMHAIGTVSRNKKPNLVVVTGDVFDCATFDVRASCQIFESFYQRLIQAIGSQVPIVLVPGNHDRRFMGLVGPHREQLFDALAEHMQGRVYVHGTESPYLSSVIESQYHGQAFWLVAYDSSYLPEGLLSAGGVLRQQDILQASSIISDINPEWPVIFLIHHHLVPTPLTDIGLVHADNQPAIVKWGIQKLLPRVIANADREEVAMTALGAGTGLTMLHQMKRAVLVLHGHKHYAAARLLKGVSEPQGDVLIVSAGSCGVAQSWHPVNERYKSKLRPSFNLISLENNDLKVTKVEFGYEHDDIDNVYYSALVEAQKDGPYWWHRPVSHVATASKSPRVSLNKATYTMTDSKKHLSKRWDYSCDRVIEGYDGEEVTCIDLLHVPLDAGVRMNESSYSDCIEFRLTAKNVQFKYLVTGGCIRTLSELQRLRGRRALPFEFVALENPFRADCAQLYVSGVGDRSPKEAFASVTDLSTGLEAPARINILPNQLQLQVDDCAPNTLLKIYWSLDRS